MSDKPLVKLNDISLTAKEETIKIYGAYYTRTYFKLKVTDQDKVVNIELSMPLVEELYEQLKELDAQGKL